MILHIFARIASAKNSIAVLFIFHIFIGLLMNVIARNITGFIPDVWFGIKENELKELFEKTWSEAERQLYIQVALLDVLGYAPTYFLLFGSCLYSLARKAHVSLKVSLFILLAFISDWVENMTFFYFIYTPNPYWKMVFISNIANRLKWISIAVICFGMFPLLLLKSIFNPEKQKHT